MLLDLRWVVRQVQEQRDALHTSILFKISCKESACLQVDTHSTKDDGEVIVVVVMHALRWLSYQTSLPTNLGGNFIVGQTGC